METSTSTLDYESWTTFLKASMAMPELICLVFLLLGIYGMYQGIEIQHPLYAILFLDLIVTLFFTVVNMAAYVLIPSDRFQTVSNTNSGFVLFFHCTCWCVTSLIRYIYIVHDSWLHNAIPSTKSQCRIAFGIALGLSFLLSIPVYGYAFYMGKHYSSL
jgi:hypothetical protein